MAFRYTCGHCGVRTIGRVTGKTIKFVDSLNCRPFCLVRCDGCENGTFISFNFNTGYIAEIGKFDDNDFIVDFSELHDSVQFPVKTMVVPEYLPKLLDETYCDAEFNFLEQRWKAAAQLYLQTLEFACLSIRSKNDEELTELESTRRVDLTKRINELFDDGLITASLKDWAHQIRVVGQYNKHRYIQSEEVECRELRGFVEMFLRYSITVPKQIEARRERIKSDK